MADRRTEPDTVIERLRSVLQHPAVSSHGQLDYMAEDQLQNCLTLLSETPDATFDAGDVRALLGAVLIRLRQDRLTQKAQLQKTQFALQESRAQLSRQDASRLSGDGQAMALLLAELLSNRLFPGRGKAFDREFYLAQNPDVARAGARPLRHFVKSGAGEGRVPVDLRRRYPACYENLPTVPGSLSEFLAGSRAVPCSEVFANIRHLALDLVDRNQPKISVIIPTWNRAGTIVDAVSSALLQSVPPHQVIVVDDGSTDGTAQLLQSRFGDVLDKGRLVLIGGGHRGVSAARNTGLDAADGDIIAYLDSDNQWEADHLLYATCGLLEEPEYRWAYTAMNRHELDAGWSDTLFSPFDPDRLRKENYIDLNCLVHHRDLSDRYGGFDTELRRLVDWDLILRFSAGHPARAVPVVTVQYFISGTGLGNISTTEALAPNAARIAQKLRARDPGT